MQNSTLIFWLYFFVAYSLSLSSVFSVTLLYSCTLCSLVNCYVLHCGPGEIPFWYNVYMPSREMTVKTHLT